MWQCAGRVSSDVAGVPGVPALHAAITKTLDTAIKHLPAPRHIGLMYQLSVLSHITMMGARSVSLLHHMTLRKATISWTWVWPFVCQVWQAAGHGRITSD